MTQRGDAPRAQIGDVHDVTAAGSGVDDSGIDPAGPIGSLRPGRTLTALTSSALALPGIAGSARADAPIEQATGSAAFSYYKEDNLSPGKFLDDGSGSRERYEVFTGQMRFDIPTSERTDIGIDLLYEEMSGASPWFVQSGPSGEALQVMSGATIEDRRFDLQADIDFYLEDGKDSFRSGFSLEQDYASFNFGLGTERSFADKNTTLSFSGGFSYDWIEPTDADLFPTIRPEEEEKWSVDLFAGLSQVLTRASTAQITLNYKHSDGYLSDPYKAIQEVNGGSGLLSDERPDTKDQVSILLRYRHHIEPITASIHADYRFYTDSWSSTSHTFELAWYQSLMNWLTITPSLRYYSQSKTDFYTPLLADGVIPDERSSDFRLSPYGAVSWRIKAEAEVEDLPIWGGLDLIAALSWERYLSDGDLAFIDVKEAEEAPGLVGFNIFAVSLTGRF